MICSQCKLELPASLDFFHKDTRLKSGLKSYCKGCQKLYQSNKEEQSLYRSKNRDKINLAAKKFRDKNKEKHKLYQRIRYKNDPVVRLISNLRNGINRYLNGYKKDKNTINYMGCNIDELWIHLELQFAKGMVRDNYGKWHIDHIRPLSSFDFSGDDKEEQLSSAWHYSNLQPLWAKDNLSKGSKFNE